MYHSWLVPSSILPGYNSSNLLIKKCVPEIPGRIFSLHLFFYFTTSTHLPGAKACMVLSYIASQEVAGR